MSRQDFVIPLRPRRRLVAWKKGEEAACARGIPARKERELAERIWLAERNRPEGWQSARSLYAPVTPEPLYQKTLLAIQQHRNRQMNVALLRTHHTSLQAFQQSCARSSCILQFIVEELREKGWQTTLEFESLAEGGQLYLVSDFTL
jgi:hypothetical protein